MPLEAQTRLLRVLQQGEYTTVGGRTPIKTDVRIIAATNRDLRQLISQGMFREDLYYRLNVVPLRLPPLRERVEDIPDLVRHFLRKAEDEGLPHKTLDSEALDMLRRHRARDRNLSRLPSNSISPSISWPKAIGCRRPVCMTVSFRKWSGP